MDSLTNTAGDSPENTIPPPQIPCITTVAETLVRIIYRDNDYQLLIISNQKYKLGVTDKVLSLGLLKTC